MEMAMAVGDEGFERCGSAGIYVVSQWTTLVQSQRK